MTEINYEERVARGIALLDEKFPGWAEHINLALFDIQDPSYCVLSYLSYWQTAYRSYAEGKVLLGLPTGGDNYDREATDHGFNVDSDPSDLTLPRGYDMHYAFIDLTNVWRREIAARQEAAS